ncbi:hypothetical protein BS639_12480 [Rouxiella silvae]|uniref:Uncharacterized protein n=1 Tax=Rouxiella silvae TaxID=1646373 RepID=A0ABX3U083_9GAMM|nr:hypothetical protein [Rouxiella silvae]ORJ20894.1 hypothetical protein BS639_12480 [Rouxiella silvae]
MKPRLSIAVIFLFITFGAMAKDIMHLKSMPTHRGGFNSHNSFADTAETPDENIREDHHKTGRIAS